MQSVSLSDTTSGALIYYTTNGTTPSTASSQFIPGTPLTISASETVEAIAVESGYTQSAVASATYTINALPVAATPTFSLAGGTYTGTQSVSLSDTTSGALIYYTTNGTTPSTASSQFIPGTPLTISASETVEAIAVESGYTQSAVASATYTINALPVAATPTFSLAGGTYTGTQSVSLSDTTSGALIYYTTNGTTPSTASSQFIPGTPLTISASETVEAIAVESGYTQSAVASATYTIASSAPVEVSLVAAANVVGLSSPGTAVTGGGIDGSGNAFDAALLGTSITWSGATFAFGTEGVNDAVSSATISLPAGNYSQLTMLATGANSNWISQSFIVTYTDGTTTTFTQSISNWDVPQNYSGESQVLSMPSAVGSSGAASTKYGPFYLYGYSFALNSAKVVKSIQLPSNRNVVVLAIDLSPTGSLPVAATPTFSLAGGTYTGMQSVSLSDTTSGALIYYTTNGTTPSTASSQFIPGTPLTISASETVEAIAVESGYTQSAVASATYTINALPVAATPTFSLAGGTYTGTQSVSLSDTTSGALIYYTTNGTTPSTASSQFIPGTPLTISASETVEAIAVESGYTQSAVASATYTINALPVAATPTFSLAGGTYTGTQSVSLSDTTSGALIYYTTNGTTPSTASSQFIPGTPLTISASETVEAIAVESGYTQSAVASATYTIASSAPVEVSLVAAANVVGLSSPGTAVTGGGIDGSGNAFDAALLGTSITWSGMTFAFGTEGVNDAVSSATISLPAGNYSQLTMLATGANSNWISQSFIVTYTDGTTTTFTQSISNWDVPQNYSGESQVLSMPSAVGSSGAASTKYGPFYLYGYSFALNSAKVVKSIQLPSNRNVVVLAIDLSPVTAPVDVSLVAAANVVGLSSPGTAVTGGGIDGSGNAFDAALLGTSITWSGMTFAFGTEGVNVMSA